MNVPLYLTLLRILSIPIVVVAYYLPFHWAHPLAAIIFILAAITDWLDGYLARHLSQITQLGAFLDPVADKLLVAVVLVLVVGEHQGHYLAIPAAVIIGREIAISALREWMAEIGKRKSVAVSYLGKIKTTVQIIAVIALLWVNQGTPAWMMLLGTLLLYIAAVLTIWSMFLYLKMAWSDLILHRK